MQFNETSRNRLCLICKTRYSGEQIFLKSMLLNTISVRNVLGYSAMRDYTLKFYARKIPDNANASNNLEDMILDIKNTYYGWAGDSCTIL